MKQKGFTLIEVLIGTAVLGMMVVLIWMISSTNLDAIERTEKRDVVYQMARFAVRRVTEDINMAFLVANSELTGKTSDGAKVEIAFIGEGGALSKLTFNSFSNWRMFRNAKTSDQCEIGYYTEPNEEISDTYNIMRRVSPNLDDDIESGGKAYAVAEGIKRFELEFYDSKNDKWVTDWSSKEVDHKDKMPKAVKISVIFPDPSNEEEEIPFITIATIGLWQFPLEF